MRRSSVLFVAAMVGLALALPGASAGTASDARFGDLHGWPESGRLLYDLHHRRPSGPTGENPTGQVRIDVFGGAFRLGGPVTCLAVNGNTATINLQDQLGGVSGITTVQVTDSSTDSFDALPINRAPTDCSPLAPTGLGGELPRSAATSSSSTRRPCRLDRPMQERRLADLRPLQEPGRLRQLRRDRREEPPAGP